MGLHLWFQRPETKAAAFRSVHQLVQAQGVSQSFLHHKGGIVYQIIGGYDVQLIILFFQPAGEFIADRGLPGGNQGQFPDILRTDKSVGGQRAVLRY